MSEPAPSARRPSRTARAAVLLLLGAAATAAAGWLRWGTADFLDPLRGTLHQTVSGSQVRPELIPIALAALAGLGAALATRGVARRAIGLLIAVAGIIVTARGIGAIAEPPLDLLADLPRQADLVGDPSTPWWPPALAVLGGLLIAAAGLLLILDRTRHKGLSARYDRAATKPAAPADPLVASESAALDLWRSLDAQHDPTADAPGVAKPGPAER